MCDCATVRLATCNGWCVVCLLSLLVAPAPVAPLACDVWYKVVLPMLCETFHLCEVVCSDIIARSMRGWLAGWLGRKPMQMPAGKSARAARAAFVRRCTYA